MNRRRLLKLIGKDCPVSVLVTPDQGAVDIMQRMALKHKKCAPEYDAIANEFSDGNIYDICERLFNFCKSNIYYSEESIDVQSISAPQTILHRGHCDCKGYALFIAGVLDSLKRNGFPVNWVYRFASYKIFDETPGHVFVVVDPGAVNEIWIDPVLKKFNDHKEYCYHIDRKIKTDAMKINGVGYCGNGIGTVSQTGAIIKKIAPELAVIPVVGWVAAAVGTVFGAALEIFGSKHNQSPEVLWLVQLYQQNVLGQKGITASNANDALTGQAQAWFTAVLGVPIGGRSDFNYLQNGVGDTNQPKGIPATQRAKNYLLNRPWPTPISMASALEAAQIAEQYMNPYNATPGSWNLYTVAPSLIADKSQVAALSVNSSGQLVNSTGTSTTNTNYLILGAAAIAAYLILSK